MAVAGLKIDFWKFWLVQKFSFDEDSHVSKNLSKIPSIRGPNCTFFWGGYAREGAQIFNFFSRSFLDFEVQKLIFEIKSPRKDLEKKVENFAALARISSLKEMAVAGLKIDI